MSSCVQSIVICGRASIVVIGDEVDFDGKRVVDAAIDGGGDDGALALRATGNDHADDGRAGNIANICDGNDDVRVTADTSAPSVLAARGRLEPATLRTPVLGVVLAERRFDFFSGTGIEGTVKFGVALAGVTSDDADDDDDDDDERIFRRFFCLRATVDRKTTVQSE
jgi:hypothetical protein